MFKYDWSLIDVKTDLIFMVGVAIVFTMMGGSDFAWYAAGTTALLAWCTILLVPPQSRRRDFTGLGWSPVIDPLHRQQVDAIRTRRLCR